MVAQVTFYFDLISPFSYIAFKLLKQVIQQWNLNIIPTPVSVAHIVGSTGGRGPASIPAKRKFLGQDLQRTCLLYGIPFNPLENFLSIPMKNANLLAIAASKKGTQYSDRVIEIIWDAFFGRGERQYFVNGNMEDLKQLLKEANIEGVDELIDMAISEDTLSEYEKNNQVAIEEGAFGVPTMVILREDGEKQMFFGSDRLHHIAAFIHTDMSLLFTPPIIKQSKL